jgi:Ran GTPase-activating protein (RanGAP) involved in mRNA processing and transport
MVVAVVNTGSVSSTTLEAAIDGDAKPPSNQVSDTKRRGKVSPHRVALVLVCMVFIFSVFISIILFFLDGSLAARLALWGLLPEAYAALSVPSICALLRLKKGTLQFIELQGCVSDVNAVSLGEAIRDHGSKADLKGLSLPYNGQLSASGVGSMCALALIPSSPLVEINLSGNPQVGDAIVVAMAPYITGQKKSQLRELKLGNCGITLCGAKALGNHLESSMLKILDLSNNDLAGGGSVLAAFCDAPLLEELSLKNCSIQDEDVCHLAKELCDSSISTLELDGNSVSDEGLVALGEHLKGPSQIMELSLAGNRIEKGDALLRFAASWASSPDRVGSRLELQDNLLSYDELMDFHKMLRTLVPACDACS